MNVNFNNSILEISLSMSAGKTVETITFKWPSKYTVSMETMETIEKIGFSMNIETPAGENLIVKP